MMLGSSVREAQERISAREFAEWQAFDSIEPFGLLREDLRAGIVASTFANVFRGKDTKLFKATDFIPTFSREIEFDPEDVDLVFGKVAAIFDAKARARGEL